MYTVKPLIQSINPESCTRITQGMEGVAGWACAYVLPILKHSLNPKSYALGFTAAMRFPVALHDVQTSLFGA